MISKMTTCFLICLTILYGSFTLCYNFVLIGDQSGNMNVLATSGDGSGDSAGNSERTSDDSNPDDSSPDDSNPDDSSPPSSEDLSDDPGIDCHEGMVLIEGECRDAAAVGGAAAEAAKGGGGDAASSPGVLSAQPSPPPDIMASMGAADVGTPQNEYSSPGNDKFHLNSEDIASELSSLTPLQIAEYPITDLSNNDLMLALSFLAPADLGKVLTNIPVQDLVVVKERLGESKFNEFLSMVSVSDREVLENVLTI